MKRRNPDMTPNDRFWKWLSGAAAVAFVIAVVAVLADSQFARAGENAKSEPEDVSPRDIEAPCSARLAAVPLGSLSAGGPARRDLESGFGADDMVGVEENIEILSESTGPTPVMRVHYPEGSINFGSTDDGRPLGGAQFFAPLPRPVDGGRLCLRYQVRFPENFEFVKGGKLPGLYAGEAPSGGDEVSGTEGWSVRLMWREDGQGELYEYVHNMDQDYGLSVGRGIFTFPRGRWVTIDLETVLNEPGEANGIARLWVDGVQVIEQDNIVFRTDDATLPAGMMFSTFFGGNDEDWASPKDQHVDFAGFRMYTGRR